MKITQCTINVKLVTHHNIGLFTLIGDYSLASLSYPGMRYMIVWCFCDQVVADELTEQAAFRVESELIFYSLRV